MCDFILSKNGVAILSKNGLEYKYLTSKLSRKLFVFCSNALIILCLFFVMQKYKIVISN